MAFTDKERERRHREISQILEKKQLKALLLIGDTNVGPGFNGDLRYYTDNRVIFFKQAILIFPQSEPILFAGTEIQRQAAMRRSPVKDCRLIGESLVTDIIKLLKERGVSQGKIGVNLEMLPTAYYLYFKKELPEIEWMETHDQMLRIRSRHSQEEIEVLRKAATLADEGFEAVLKMIRPGVNEFEIAATIEQAARSRGGEEHFTLIGSGKFSFGEDNTLPLPYSPSYRKIEVNDSVVMEITPRYEGYWTQLVRTVNVGRPNKDLEKLHRVCRDAIEKGLERFKPGHTIRDVVLAMGDYVESCGYLMRPPIGHICAVDLMEARVSVQNETMLEPGMAVIIHPTVLTPNAGRSFFWGETYLVKDDGYERLHRSTDELLTIEERR